MSVFVPVSQSLKYLDIRRNLLGDISLINYPASVGELVGLEELRMDCLRNKSLPMEYDKLKKLAKLSFTEGRKEVGFIRNGRFKAVSKSGMTDVNLAELNIGVIGNGTFLNLPKLRTLDLSNNPYVIIQIDNIIPSLKQTALQTLHLNHTGIGQAESTTLGELHLKELTLDDNDFEQLDPVFSEYLPELEVLSLENNFIDFGANLLKDLKKLKHLTGLNVSWQNSINSNNTRMLGKKLQRITNKKPPGSYQCNMGMACPLLLQPKLHWIDISHFLGDAQSFPEFALIENNTLHSIDLSYNRIKTIKNPVFCAKSTLSAVVPQIQTINFNNNGLQCINSTFLRHCDWNSLLHLHLRNNQLGQTEGNVCNQDKNNTLGFLKPAKNLEHLDLAGNQIRNENILSEIQYLIKLKVIDLSDNGLHNFSLELENMTGISLAFFKQQYTLLVNVNNTPIEQTPETEDKS